MTVVRDARFGDGAMRTVLPLLIGKWVSRPYAMISSATARRIAFFPVRDMSILLHDVLVDVHVDVVGTLRDIATTCWIPEGAE